jgi:hypothetical protein
LVPKAHAQWVQLTTPAQAKTAKREARDKGKIKSSGRKGVLVSLLKDDVEALRSAVRMQQKDGGAAR